MSEVSKVRIDDLKQHPDNARIGDVNAIARSLERFGQVKPIIVQRSTSYVVAGNHTLKAAKALGWEFIEAMVLDMDDSTARAYLLADNATSDRATYDKAALIGVLGKTLSNLEGTGFTEEDFESLAEDASQQQGRRRRAEEDEEFESRDVEDAPEPTREIPLHIRTSEMETFAEEVHNLQDFWRVSSLSEVVTRAVAETHDRLKANATVQGKRPSTVDVIPDELKAGSDY